MNLFKGYVPTKNKKCLMPFKGKSENELMTYEQVKNYSEYAGVLADEAILIDIDNSEQSELLMNIVEAMQLDCRVYQTTRGKHFLFMNNGIENCGTNQRLAIGLTADIKVGSKNSYEVLKIDGEERFIEWDVNPGDKYQQLPKWLFPVKGSTVDFSDLGEGDGRNQALYNYILTLQAADFTVDEIRETIRLINKYILKVPLSDDELEVILRDDAFKKQSFFKGTTFLFDKFANYIKSTHHIKRVNGQLHIYQDGIYGHGYSKIEAEMIKHIPQLSRARRTEVLSYLEILIPDTESETFSSPNLIAFKNGILDVITGELHPFSHEYIISNRIPWNYNPNAYHELADKTLNKIACGDTSIRMLLEEIMGACMYRSNDLAGGKAFILVGGSSNGKSTFIKVIKTILGKDNYSALDMSKLDDRFSTVRIYGKLANVGDDIGDLQIQDSSTLKKIVTGESIEAEQKGQPKFEFEPFCKLVFSANNIPRIGKGRDSAALKRRLIIVPFEATFKEDDPDFDSNIKWKLTQSEAIEYFIKLAVEGLQRVIKNQRYTESEKVKKAGEEYAEENDSILSFLKDCEDADFKIDDEPTEIVYQRYLGFCADNGFPNLTKTSFSKLMKRHGFITKVKGMKSGKTTRIYTRDYS